MSRTSFAGLQERIKLVRDNTVEGLYDTFFIFFDGVVAQINKHLSTIDDPLVRTKWMNDKKAISEETKVVKQLDAERRAFKETPSGRRPPSPPISTKSSFVFQPLNDYQTSSSGPMDDFDVQRPSSRDNASRRPTRSGQVGTQLGSHRKMGVGLEVLQELVLLGVGERVVLQAGLTQESMHQLQERKALVLEGLVQQIRL